METALGPTDGETGQSARELPAPVMPDFGDYELLDEIGRGGQGVVFRARQKSLNRIVAVKVIRLGPWATDAHLKRFRREAEAAASLNHPGIVPIYEVGERDGSCYFSMQYVEGGQLDELVRQKPLSVRAAVELVIKLARTVHYAHERGTLHRDIKPGNILVDDNGEPHLTDFGLARLVETESTVTHTLEVLGTPSYIAPEQAMGKSDELTRATDVYGLGAVFYQLLTGHPPFAGGTTYETIRLVLETEPRRLRLLNSKVDCDLETICLKCLQKNPSARYNSALEVAEDLERWLNHQPIHARRIGFVARSSKWVRRQPALAALLLLMAVLATVVVIVLSGSNSQPAPAGIAVLPFENLGGDKQDTTFADGIQDDILTKLAKVAGLKVISRTSVMQFRRERNMRKIGQALHVSHVLEGSVRRSDGRIRLNAQLIDARTDQHVWAEQYDRELRDAFSIQSELAQEIASQLRANITRAEAAAIQKTPTRDLQAYQLYLRGKELRLSARIPALIDDTAKIKEAVQLLEKAIGRDPEFALAYSVLAQASLDLYWQEPHSLADRARAESALANARRLAPDAGETHLAAGCFHYYGERDYQRALDELEKAIALLPNNAEVFVLLGRLDRRLGRWTDSIRHYHRAIELDPREPRNLYELNLTYYTLKHYREADEIADRGIAAFPNASDSFWMARSETALAQGNTARARRAMETSSQPNVYLLYRISLCERNFAEAKRSCAMLAQAKELSALYPPSYYQAIIARLQGDREKGRESYLVARQFFQNVLRDHGESPEPHDCLALLESLYGSKEEALRQAEKAIELLPISRDLVGGMDLQNDLAAVYGWTGEHDKAIEQLAAIIKMPGSPSYGELKLSPLWDPLRDDPRFAQLVADAAKPLPLP